LRFAIGATQVDAEHLYAALSAYLLAGIYLGLSYWVLEQMKPGTFSFTGEFPQPSAIYFSFVTLATLGTKPFAGAFLWTSSEFCKKPSTMRQKVRG
jgi:hypothetical protein